MDERFVRVRLGGIDTELRRAFEIGRVIVIVRIVMSRVACYARKLWRGGCTRRRATQCSRSAGGQRRSGPRPGRTVIGVAKIAGDNAGERAIRMGDVGQVGGGVGLEAAEAAAALDGRLGCYWVAAVALLADVAPAVQHLDFVDRPGGASVVGVGAGVCRVVSGHGDAPVRDFVR